MDSMQGKFLVASPHLTDDNFYKTVILMIQHDDQGALGVVLNRPSQSALSDVWSLFSPGECPSDATVFIGGPVPGPLLALHREASFSDSEVIDGVYVASGEDRIREIITAECESRFFTGYSGWSAGQLDQEMESGGWLSTPATCDEVFLGDNEQLWKRVTEKIGLDIVAPTVPVNRVPPTPDAN